MIVLLNEVIISLTIGVVVGTISCFILKKVDKKKKYDPEYIKTMYGIYITNFDEYKDYFMKYEFGKYVFIKNNELLPEEYANLVKSYVNKFIELYGEAESTKVIIDVKFNNIESFIKYMIRDFDVFLFNKSIISKEHLEIIHNSRKEENSYV